MMYKLITDNHKLIFPPFMKGLGNWRGDCFANRSCSRRDSCQVGLLGFMLQPVTVLANLWKGFAYVDSPSYCYTDCRMSDIHRSVSQARKVCELNRTDKPMHVLFSHYIFG